MKKGIIIFLLLFLVIPFFSLGEETDIYIPVSFQEIEDMGKEKIESGGMIALIKNIWNDEVVPFFRKSWEIIIGFWNNKIKPLFQKEIDKRGSAIREELEKEKNEIKEEAPNVGKSLWEKFKRLIHISD